MVTDACPNSFVKDSNVSTDVTFIGVISNLAKSTYIEVFYVLNPINPTIFIYMTQGKYETLPS